jgi:hypothetical protein
VDLSSGLKRPERDADHSSITNASEVISGPQYVFTA